MATKKKCPLKYSGGKLVFKRPDGTDKVPITVFGLEQVAECLAEAKLTDGYMSASTRCGVDVVLTRRFLSLYHSETEAHTLIKFDDLEPGGLYVGIKVLLEQDPLALKVAGGGA